MKDNLLDKTLEVLSSLNDEKVEYIVIGGVALNLHGLIRATEDLDLFLRPQPENINALRQALKQVWNDPEIDLITDEDLCGSYPAVRYGPPDETLPLDILTRLGEFACYDDLEYEIIELENVHIRVATPKTLLWLKAKTVRPQDKADAEALCLAFDLKVEDEA